MNHGKLPPKETSIEINCYQIPEADIVNNPNKTGEYNVPLYLSKFNKHVEPLLVVFKPEIRDTILVDNPEKRGYFTTLQCELDSGHPLKPEGQDSLDEVMTLSDMEVMFWNRVERDPYFMYVEDSLSLVDQDWVEFNRKLVADHKSNVKDGEDEVISTDGNDYALHAINT